MEFEQIKTEVLNFKTGVEVERDAIFEADPNLKALFMHRFVDRERERTDREQLEVKNLDKSRKAASPGAAGVSRAAAA